MKRYRTVLLVLVIAILAAGIYAYREYHRKPAALNELSADQVISADSLLAAYSLNEEAANKKFLGKVIDVTGTVAAITGQQDTVANVQLGAKEGIAHVSCSISLSEISKLKELSEGKVTTIRGVCTGYLMDVELNRCVIIK